MSSDIAQATSQSALAPSIDSRDWLVLGAALLSSITLLFLTYPSTVLSAVHIWETNKTYGYAFAVLPIIVYLLWRDRDLFRRAKPAPTFAGTAIAGVFAALWLIGAKRDVLELQHVAMAGLIIALVVAAIGWTNAARLWLPLTYLFLLAPAGTPLLPFLQGIATFISKLLLEIGQIPYYDEGNTIQVATGKYEVAPGCAGLDFVLAMATVAPLYSVLMFDNWSKRLTAVALMMAVVPIANGVRIFGIIAIAEYTNKAIDITADHLLYGWIFFSLIVVLLFWLGSFFADPPRPPSKTSQKSNTVGRDLGSGSMRRKLAMTLLAATVICLLPAYFV